MTKFLTHLFLSTTLLGVSAHAQSNADFALAAQATNAFGLDLLRQQSQATPNTNLLLSPYSVQSALLLTYLGANGTTRSEMQRALHYPANDNALVTSFAALQASLKTPPISPADGTLLIANRLFLEKTQPLLSPYKNRLRDLQSPTEQVDFIHHSADTREHINRWIADQTQQKIPELIPAGGIDKTTRLALANALYFKAPWLSSFRKAKTKPRPFNLSAQKTINTPTLHQTHKYPYAQTPDYELIGLPYADHRFQLLILLPESNTTTPLSQLTPDLLSKGQSLEAELLELYLPKFQLNPQPTELSLPLQNLGLKTAFDIPVRSADFSLLAKPKPEGYIKLQSVYHQCTIEVNEEGTEATASTVALAALAAGISSTPPKPRVVRIDRPFAFALQHVESGTCLFIGQILDPR